jgi:S-adenosylmethionine synthetase
MLLDNCIFTSESVTEGHPDKVSDGISDAILDAHLALDPNARVACETLVNTGLVVIAGEISGEGVVRYADIVRDKIKRIGYTESGEGFDADSCAVMVTLDSQSADISQGVTAGKGLYKEQGAGDQGMMFGYACDETPELMPAPIMFSHRLAHTLAKVRRNGTLPFLRPDGKTQVSIRYEKGKPIEIDTVVVSTQHSADIKYRDLKSALIEEVIKPSLPAKMLSGKTRFLVNPTGRFVVGGPHGYSGLTGSKKNLDTN